MTSTAALQACPLFSALLQKALDLIRSCDCVVGSGCPGCIQHTGCSQYNAVRALMLRMLPLCSHRTAYAAPCMHVDTPVAGGLYKLLAVYQVLHKRAAEIVLECTIAAEAEYRQRREASGVWPAEEDPVGSEQLGSAGRVDVQSK